MPPAPARRTASPSRGHSQMGILVWDQPLHYPGDRWNTRPGFGAHHLRQGGLEQQLALRHAVKIVGGFAFAYKRQGLVAIQDVPSGSEPGGRFAEVDLNPAHGIYHVFKSAELDAQVLIHRHMKIISSATTASAA